MATTHPAAPAFTNVPPAQLATARLRLRQWTEADREPFAAMNADPVVMEHFHAPLTRAQSDEMLDRFSARIAERGWGFWAVDYLASSNSAPQFIGFVGLNIPPHDLPFNPCVEVGWRLAQPYWGKGLATEAARLALRVGFDLLGLDEIVAMANKNNLPSRAVMDRLGMKEAVGEEFEHPAVPEGSHARAMCLYRLKKIQA